MDEAILERDHIRESVRHLKEVHGVTYFPIIAIVYAMAVAPEAGYHNTLWSWSLYDHKIAGYPAAEAWWWHNEICRHLLKAGADVSEGTAQWFEARAKEVRELEN